MRNTGERLVLWHMANTKAAVFTVMLGEGYGLQQAAELVRAYGFDGIEWRVHESWHIPLAQVEQLAGQVYELCASNGLDICALSTYLAPSDPELVAVFYAAAAVEANLVRVAVPRFARGDNYFKLLDQTKADLDALLPLCERTGVKACIETHHGNIACSASLAKAIVGDFPPELVGVIYDPGNMVHEGYENYRLGVQILGPHLAHVHVKNAGWFRDEEGTWRCRWTPVREGIVDWLEVAQDLAAAGFDGFLSFEDFSDAPVEQRLSEDIALIRDIRGQ